MLAVQATGSQVIIWSGVPIYRRLSTVGGAGASLNEAVPVFAAVVIMQLAHWVSLPLMQSLRFRRNLLLGHVLTCIGELSIFFTAALASLILFSRVNGQDFFLWKLFILVAIVFAVSSYKYQIMSLGDRMITTDERKPNHAKK